MALALLDVRIYHQRRSIWTPRDTRTLATSRLRPTAYIHVLYGQHAGGGLPLPKMPNVRDIPTRTLYINVGINRYLRECRGNHARDRYKFWELVYQSEQSIINDTQKIILCILSFLPRRCLAVAIPFFCFFAKRHTHMNYGLSVSYVHTIYLLTVRSTLEVESYSASLQLQSLESNNLINLI